MIESNIERLYRLMKENNIQLGRVDIGINGADCYECWDNSSDWCMYKCLAWQPVKMRMMEGKIEEKLDLFYKLCADQIESLVANGELPLFPADISGGEEKNTSKR